MTLNTKVAVHLVKGGGEQHAEDFKKLNPMEQVRLGVTCHLCHDLLRVLVVEHILN